jgi:hypothetical protein
VVGYEEDLRLRANEQLALAAVDPDRHRVLVFPKARE